MWPLRPIASYSPMGSPRAGATCRCPPDVKYTHTHTHTFNACDQSNIHFRRNAYLRRVFDTQLSDTPSTQLPPAFSASPGGLRTRRDPGCLLLLQPAVTLPPLPLLRNHYLPFQLLLPMWYNELHRWPADVRPYCSPLGQISRIR